MRDEVLSVRCKFLVIGYGNTLRSDDGAGVRVAEAIAAWNLRGVTSLCRASARSRARRAARFRGARHLRGRSTRPRWIGDRRLASGARRARYGRPDTPAILDPCSLWPRLVYGHHPRAWLVTVPAFDLSVGEGLSRTAVRGIEGACGRIWRILDGR